MPNSIECLRPNAVATNAKVALFDFDGTISLIRAGWEEVMVPMMVGILLDLKTGESEEQLREVVLDYVGHLTGRQTIYQMIALCDEIQKRGGTPKDPLYYKHLYLDLLMDMIKDRIAGLRSGEIPPVQYQVPGTIELLDGLKERGFKMFLASGTDDKYVKDEAALLKLDHYFDGGIYGALDDYKSFSKAILIK